MDKLKEKAKPLKRHPALVPLSRDHHFGLLLCWKIRMGLKTGIEPERIASYTLYFHNDHLLPHFKAEEECVFVLVDEKNEKRKKAESQHRRLGRLAQKLVDEPEKLKITLGQIEEELDLHIRFEERDFFPYIQEQQDEEGLELLRIKLEEIHEEVPEVWEDKFWEKKPK